MTGVIPTSIHSVTDADVDEHTPFLVGAGKWECATGATYTYKDDEWAEQEIAAALRKVAQLEAIRRARTEMDLIAVVDQAEYLCRLMYGQDLPAFEEHAGQKFVRGLYRAAQALVAKDQG